VCVGLIENIDRCYVRNITEIYGRLGDVMVRNLEENVIS
jgi:hypothetical protein